MTLKSVFSFSRLFLDVISSKAAQVLLKSLCFFAKLFPETSQETFWVVEAQIPPPPAPGGTTLVLPLPYT